jgi:hypothetical protein
VIEAPWPPPYVSHFPPDGVSYAAGEEAAEFAERSLGIVLDPWQYWVLLNCLSESRPGKWASFENAIITPRQNGKNFILEVFELASLYLFGDKTIVHSAHKFDTSVEHFNRIKELMQESPELSKLLLPKDRSFVTSNGKEHIRLKSGQRLLFKARYRGGTRGFTGDKVVMDEAFDLDPSAMGSVIPTLSTRPGAQVYYTSSAPHANSQVLHAVRARALKGDSRDRLFYAEYGNPSEVLDLDPVADEEAFMDAIRRANPAVAAGRISEEYITQEIRTFSGTQELVTEHHRERLGVVSLPQADKAGLVQMDRWWALEAVGVEPIVEGLCLGFDVAEDRGWASFGVAGRVLSGLLQVEVAASQSVTDVDDAGAPGWVVPYAVKLWEAHRVPIRVEKGSPAGAYISRLEAAGVEVEVLGVQDHAHALGQFLDAVALGELQHLGDEVLAGQVQVVEDRKVGDVMVWSRRRAKNVSGLVAVTLALGGVPEWEPVKKKKIGMVFG